MYDWVTWRSRRRVGRQVWPHTCLCQLKVFVCVCILTCVCCRAMQHARKGCYRMLTVLCCADQSVGEQPWWEQWCMWMSLCFVLWMLCSLICWSAQQSPPSPSAPSPTQACGSSHLFTSRANQDPNLLNMLHHPPESNICLLDTIM